ncbi:hypothetical protein H5410_051609 [Solanum commersonii]|uniref:ATP-dependent DNA helicase n=1 Tax=Solanum commersonii TaxID=4109 RepID=A0A9J5X181_SOLCO|nr:hypothetical protein H5410_051609 [Solanum commersonii]
MNINTLFGGKVVVFGGDFRQTLPIVQNGSKDDFINENLLNSPIWSQLEKYQLLQNMRARTDPAFYKHLLKIGDGRETTNEHGKIEIPKSFLIPFTNEKDSLNILSKTIHPNFNMFSEDISSITSRVILTTKNDFVAEINQMLIDRFPGDAITFVGIDETIDPRDQTEYEDFLHTLNPSGLPPYRLILKQNCPVILLRNLNPSKGLCNDTRLICLDFKTQVISAKIASGDFKGSHKMTQHLLIHQMTPETPLWTCKVQIVDIYGPAESKEKKEYQTKATVYANDIPSYQKRIKLYHTFRITGGRAQTPYLRYENSMSAFNWVLDKKSIIDPIKKDDVDALLPPTKLNVTSFADIKRNVAQTMATDLTKKEFVIHTNKCSSFCSKQNLTFTIWEKGIIENEGRKLLHQFREYPVILARRIGASRYNGVSLTTKFDTTIQIDPPYPQRRKL